MAESLPLAPAAEQVLLAILLRTCLHMHDSSRLSPAEEHGSRLRTAVRLINDGNAPILLRRYRREVQFVKQMMRRSDPAGMHHDAAQELRARIGISGKITYASRSWQSLLGWHRADLAIGAFVERVHPDDVDGVVAAIHQVYRNGTGIHFTCRYAHRDGGYLVVAWQARPRRDIQYIDLRGRLLVND